MADRRLKVREIAETVGISEKVMAIVFWDSQDVKCDLHRLPEEGQNDHRALLYRIIGLIQCRTEEKTALFGEEKSAFPPL